MQLLYKADEKSWFLSVGQMIRLSWCLFVCICVLLFACTFMCACAFVCVFVFVLPIQEWICVRRANYLSKLMLVHSIEALKREELSLRQDSNDDDNDGGGGGNVDVG